MSEPSYPVRRETRRLRRWFETAGAEYRLIASVCPSPALRAVVEDGLSGQGGLALVPLDVSVGDLLPARFREHRGNHASFIFFVFTGLAARILREGRPAIDALEREADFFRRPATWALFWLEDPALPALLSRLAPRFWAAVQIHPSYADEHFNRSDSPDGIRRMLRDVTTRGRAPVADGEVRARALIERGDVLGLRRLLRDASFDPETLLLLEGDVALLVGDPQAALGHYAAAAAYGERRSSEATASLALTLALLGDGEGAAQRATEVLAGKPGGRAGVRAAAALATLARRAGRDADAILRDPALLTAIDAGGNDAGRELARHASEAGATELAAELYGRVVATSVLGRADLGLLLTRSGEVAETDADALLAPLASSADAEGAGVDDSTLARARAVRGLARLELERAVRALGRGDTAAATVLLQQAESGLGRARRMAGAGGLVLELIACEFEALALAAAREDLDAVLKCLLTIEGQARESGLRLTLFEALEQKARAQRFARSLAHAVGTLDELENLAYDLTLPDLERRAFEARAEHLTELEIPGEARTALRRAEEIARAIGDTVNASRYVSGR